MKKLLIIFIILLSLNLYAIHKVHEYYKIQEAKKELLKK